MSASVGWSSLVYVTLTAWLCYLIGGGVYRLYFHPLAKFPGPKLAALTGWYEAYYDLYCRGMFVWKIQEMHEKYGNVIPVARSHVGLWFSLFRFSVLILGKASF
jgi:hypothetical protein